MPNTTTQQFLTIDSIREDTLVLKDSSLRVVLMCSALNFSLKSTDEQDAIIYQYQNFLNSLDFSLQIVVHSRRLNIDPYIGSLKERQKDQDNELLKIQTNEYIEFVKTFVESTNIMSKTFYVIVPFIPVALRKRGMIEKVTGLFRTKKKHAPVDAFEEFKNQLWQRVEAVIGGLRRLGIRSAPLSTEELIELFYSLYNPTEFEKITVPADRAKESP